MSAGNVPVDAPGRHVLVVHPGADDYGADRMVGESVRGLAEAGWRVTLVVPRHGPLTEAVSDSRVDIRLVRMPVLRRSDLSPRGVLRLVADVAVGLLGGGLMLGRLRPDVVLISTVTIPWWALLARLSGRAVVWHVHETEAHLSASHRRLLFAPVNLATIVVANSQHTEAILRAAWTRLGRRTVVVMNAVSGPQSPPAPREMLGRAPRLLFVGRLSDRKGVDVAIDAVAELRSRSVSATLDVLGASVPGQEHRAAELHQRAAGLGGAVRFHGHVAAIWPALAESDILVVPSRLDESFGNVVVEGLLARRPVIVARQAGLVEAAGSAKTTRAVEPGDAISLADAVEDVMVHWADLVASADGVADVVSRRHDPAGYRAAIGSVVAGAGGVHGGVHGDAA